MQYDSSNVLLRCAALCTQLCCATRNAQGYHGDTSSMFLCGAVSEQAKRLCTVTKATLDAAIKECGPGVRFSKIGGAIQKIAKAEKCAGAPDLSLPA